MSEPTTENHAITAVPGVRLLGPGLCGRGAYIGAPLVNHVQVHIVESIDLRHCLVRRSMQRDQHQLLSC